MALPDLDNIPELGLASDGEHELEIVQAYERTSQKGEQFLKLVFTVLDEENVEDFNTILMYPTGQDKRTDAKRARKLRSFMGSFGIEGEAEPDDLIGHTGKAITRTKDAYSGDGQENDVRIFV